MIRLEWRGTFTKCSFVYLAEWSTFGLMAYAGGRMIRGRFGPIQTPAPKRPWLSCVYESGSQFEDDLGVERRGSEADQVP